MTQVKDLNRKRVCDISDDGKSAYIRRGDCITKITATRTAILRSLTKSPSKHHNSTITNNDPPERKTAVRDLSSLLWEKQVSPCRLFRFQRILRLWTDSSDLKGATYENQICILGRNSDGGRGF